MTESSFQRVLIPIEFVPVNPGEADAINAGGHWIGLGDTIRECLTRGAELAGPNGVVRLVHATPSFADAGLYGGIDGTWIPDKSLRELDHQSRETAIEVLKGLAEIVIPKATVEVAAAAGVPVDVILKHAEAFDADAIVLPTSGRGPARRFFLGSTADKVIRQAACPVLVIPRHPQTRQAAR